MQHAWIGRLVGIMASLVLLTGGVLVQTVTTGGSATVPSLAWAPTIAPVPVEVAAGTHPTFKSVSCPRPKSCTAVGFYSDSGDRNGLIDTEQSGGAWSAVKAPLPTTISGDPGVELASLSCPTTSFCAIGGWDVENGLLLTGSGASWTAITAPLPTSPAPANPDVAEIQSVQCQSSTTCVAAGDYQDSGGHRVGLIETLAGGTWTAQALPPPVANSPIVELSSLSCASTTSCAAVGVFTEPGNTANVALVATLANGSWTSMASPLPADSVLAQNSELNKVDCPTASLCVGVGEYNHTGADNGLISVYANGSWSALQAPVPAPETSGAVSFPALSCASASFCVAGGSEAADPGGGFFDTFNGSTWSAAVAPNVDNTIASPSGLSCPIPGWCAAVGSSNIQGLIWTLSLGNWSVVSAPLPPNGFVNSLSTAFPTYRPVVCSAPFRCTAVGNYLDAEQIQQGLIERLDPPAGYWEVASDGGLFSFGGAGYFGSMGGQAISAPVVGMAAAPDGRGYWEVASDGGIFSFGNANFYGSMGGKPLNMPVVGLAATPDGGGYYEVASDGGLFAFGDATFLGSMGGRPLNAPVVGIAATPDGGGYWEVAADGGLFAFGDAGFFGSMGGKPLNKPVVGLAATPDGGGYYEVASDGGLFAFGDATFAGSMGGRTLAKPIVGMAVTPGGAGYWEVASDGGIFAFGGATFYGSMGGTQLTQPVVGMAGT